MAGSQKAWRFDAATGRPIGNEDRDPSGKAYRHTNFTWDYVDAATQLQPYLWVSRSYQYGTDTSRVMSTAVEQVIDGYGNLSYTTTASGAIARTTRFTYLHQSNPAYAARYIRNRLTSGRARCQRRLFADTADGGL